MRKFHLLIVVFALVLSSCSKKGGRKSKALFINFGQESNNFNPISSQDAYSSKLHAMVLDSLLTRDVDTYKWKPALAESWEIAKDKTTFTFKLKEGIKFHDGKPITAEDVKFSFDVIFDNDYNTAHRRPYFEGIKEVKIIDPRTVVFVAKTQYYKNFDTAATLEIIPKHFYGNKKNKKDFTKKIVGSGPYTLDKYQRGKRYVLKKYKDWYGHKVKEENGANYRSDKIIIKFVKESNVSLEMLKKGKLDFEALTPEDFVKKTTGKIWGTKVHKVKTRNKVPKGYSFIGWNFKHPILKDRNVRLALYHLVNRKMMIDKFEYGMSVPANGPVYPSSPYAVKDLPTVDFNPTKANELLKKSGWKDSDGDGVLDKVVNGKKTKFEITILEPNKEFEKYLTVFKEDAKKQGVVLNIKLIEWNSFLKLLDERKFDAVRLGWTAVIDWDPKQIWHSSSIKGGSNFISYSNPEVDKLTDKARLIHDRAERIAVLSKAQKLIVNDFPYVWFTYKEDTLYAYTDEVVRPKDTFEFTIGNQYWVKKAALKKK